MGYKSSIKNWEGLAKRDAFWSILTDDSKKGGKWKKEGFFESGKREIDAVFYYLEERSISTTNSERAMDFGCGAGRLSRALTGYFDKVVGVDASPTMIELAMQNNEKFKGQLSFVLNQKDDLSRFEDNSFSFILSLITLQHIPHPQSAGFISEFIRILKPGGLLVFQVPTEDVRKLSFFQKLRHLLKIRERLALIGIGEGFQMDMYTLSFEKIKEIVAEKGARILSVANTNHTDPGFNGKLQFLKDDEAASGYISKLFVVGK